MTNKTYLTVDHPMASEGENMALRFEVVYGGRLRANVMQNGEIRSTTFRGLAVTARLIEVKRDSGFAWIYPDSYWHTFALKPLGRVAKKQGETMAGEIEPLIEEVAKHWADKDWASVAKALPVLEVA